MRMSWFRGKESKGSRERQSVAELLFTRAKMHWWLFGVIFALAAAWIAFPMEDRRKLLNLDDFELGEKSPRDVFAQVDLAYDETATEEEKQKALTEVPPVFDLDFQRLEDAKKEFSIVRKVRLDDTLTDAEKIDKMRNLFIIGPSEDVGLILVTAPDEQIEAMEKAVMQLLSEILEQGVVAGGDGVSFAEELSKIDYIKPKWKQIEERLKGETDWKPTNDQIADEIDVTLIDARLLLSVELEHQIDLDSEKISESLRQEFESSQTALSRDVIVSIKEEGSEWLITDEGNGKKTYSARKGDGKIDIYNAEKTVRVEKIRLWFQATAAARYMASKMPEPISTVVEEMCVDLMRPNLVYNADATRKRRADLSSNFPQITRRLPKGSKIISTGEIVTPSMRDKLEVMYSIQKWAAFRSIPGAVLLTALLACVLVVYLKKYEPRIFSEPRKIIALSMAIFLILALGNIIIARGHALNIDRPGFLVPAALVSIVVAILANVQLAIIVTCVIGIFIAMLAGVNLAGSLQYFLVILGGGIAAAISASRARHRRHLMIAGIYVSGVNAITILGLGLLENIPLAKLGANCLIGAINGTVVALLTPGLLPVFEYLSRTTTDMELLELADLNQPLLSQLEEKASGSYYHSLHVAQLAKAAAEAMGRDRANPLLTMVGSYYHDIGKITKPEAFIENQKGENVHDTLNPSMSARVIANHVRDGVRLAKEHKLPQVVVDIIQQHHGTTLIGGQRFYQKAMEADRHNTVRLEDYRYPGSRPQTNEAAIILLADSVESARHAVFNGSPGYNRLVRFVREIVESKIMDSQMDECDLTLKDINLITDAFVRVLSGMYHTRIEYPKKVEFAPVGAKSSTAKEPNGGEDR